MDLKQIRELARLMNTEGLSTIKIEEDGMELLLERPVSSAPPRGAEVSLEIRDEPAPCEEVGVITVRSPMVGVFYAAPSPGEKVFVTVGEVVQEGDVLCIIEAMKLMNEITSECTGEVIEVCAGNGQIVEYDQPLFRVRCSGE